ncbi:MAG: macrolide ABC transporter ATP-binding protein [Desulfobulbaceae bacterium DB1]|nr:MAG: macrolide ABC transporter ATP-binding protein [Desulfobulbaceae bacterium DB1]
MVFIDLQRISKTYDDRGLPVHALHQTNLEIGEGEFVCLAGPSGSGKTTLLNLMGCIDRPSSGMLRIKGQSVNDMGRRQLAMLRRFTFGFIFQTFNLIPVLSAFENIEYVLLLQGMEKQARHQRVKEVLEKVGLAGMMEKTPGEMSGGQQQRVAVARALAGRPAIILADEPTANLDSHTGESLFDLLRQINRSHNTTFVFSSHDPAIIQKAQRVLTMRDGSIISDSIMADTGAKKQ